MQFYNNVSSCSSDIITLTETFLNSSVYDAELFPPGFIVLRRDRAGEVGFGGTMLAVRDYLSASIISEVDGLTSDKEVLLAKIVFKNIKIIICVVYLPPSYNDKQYLSVLDCLENVICNILLYMLSLLVTLT